MTWIGNHNHKGSKKSLWKQKSKFNCKLLLKSSTKTIFQKLLFSFKSWVGSMELTLTMTWPPPGVWWALSREPTLAWALSLKSNFTVSMRTWPPPGGNNRSVLDECGGCTVLKHEVHYTAKSQWAPDRHIRNTVSTNMALEPLLLLQLPPRRFWNISVGVCAHSVKEHLLGQTLMLDTEAWLRIILITPRNVFTADILTGQVGRAQVEFLT